MPQHAGADKTSGMVGPRMEDWVVSMLQPTSSLKTLVQLENMQRIDSIESRSTKSIATHFKMGMEHEKRVKSPAQHAQPGPATFPIFGYITTKSHCFRGTQPGPPGPPGPPDAAFRSSMLNQANFASAKVQQKWGLCKFWVCTCL